MLDKVHYVKCECLRTFNL